jgi:hypothetical protein
MTRSKLRQQGLSVRLPIRRSRMVASLVRPGKGRLVAQLPRSVPKPVSEERATSFLHKIRAYRVGTNSGL